jgi:CheY-like chemotaxis protein
MMRQASMGTYEDYLLIALFAPEPFEQHRSQIQIIITDLMMPRLGGDLLVEMVRRTDASLPIIVMTGWAGEVDLDRLLARPGVALLQKPFQIDQLIRLMSEVAVCRMLGRMKINPLLNDSC